MSYEQIDSGDSNQADLEKTFQDAQTDAVDLSPGTILNDRYKLLGLLGRGGMGSVYSVEHRLLQRIFALKVLNKQQTNEAAWRRFELEARAANKLDHPNLVKVHDSDLLPDGQPYFIMDLIEGESLAGVLSTSGRLPLDRALKIFIQVGFALSYAHSNGVIHRDIKPSNIMISSVESEDAQAVLVKVVDFGIAKLTGKDEFNQQTLTKTGEIFGSPLYMSPEQCMGAAIDQRCDLYSLGCVIFEALTGAPPLVGENALATMMKHQGEIPVSLKEASMGIEFPRKMEEIVARLLEKDPQQRYQSAQHLTADLVGLDSGQLSMFDVLPAPSPSAAHQERRYSNLLLLVGGLFLLSSGFFTGQILPRKEPASEIAPKVTLIFKDGESNLLHINQSLERQITERKTREIEEFTELEKQKGFFSKPASNPKDRYFYFPSFPVGDIVITIKYRIPAQGTKLIRNFDGIGFSPSEQFQKRPKLFQKFRPDDIHSLDFSTKASFINLGEKDLSASNQALFGISHLKRVQLIDLGDTILTTEGLLQVDKFPRLSELLLTRINLSGKEIAKLKCLDQLTFLKLVDIVDIKPVIKILKKSKKLQSLVVAGCGIDDTDLKDIAEIKQLELLELANNKKVNDQSIRLLSPSLRKLDLRRCSTTSQGMPSLIRMKRLCDLQLSDTGWSESEKSKLRSQINGVSFIEGNAN